ncbi:MAG: DEAD/DEAH box helicase [Thermoplasmatota archaeon]
MAWDSVDDLPVDEDIRRLIKAQGYTELWPPQQQGLPPALQGDSVVLSVPTASGKSLVAYLAIVQAALRGRKSLYIVPLRALAREKWEDLHCFEELGISIGVSTGDYDESGSRLAGNDIVICTSEKADSLLRHGARWIDDVDIVVADEIHLMDDASRGPTMEMVLSRLRMIHPGLQVIALSATIQNAEEIAEWLGAHLVKDTWRPVPLREGVFHDGTIYYADESTRQIAGTGAISLVVDTVAGGGQCLVFVNSRRAAQRFAGKLQEHVAPYVDDGERLKQAARDVVAGEESTTIAARLAEGIQQGVAFHHAGLRSSQRRVIEDAFRAGDIKCITATPTLAAGVNTPARRVIVKHTYRYSGEAGCMMPIPAMEIAQAMGRAGRPGYDDEGEAILVARKQRQLQEIRERYINAELEPIHSKLGSEPALRIHVLSLISTDFAVTISEIIDFFNRTFYAHQRGVLSTGQLEDIVLFLERQGFIVKKGVWTATPFGRKTSSLYLDPLSAIKMREALEAPKASTFAYLHAICAAPDMRCLYVSRGDGWLEDVVDENVFALEVPLPISPDFEWFLAQVKTAALLEDWMLERREQHLVQKYGVGPGDIHSKVEVAEWLLHAMREMARIFDFDAVPELTKLIMRMRYGCKEQLLNLVELRNVGRVRARALYKAGFRSVNDLRKASIARLQEIPHIGAETARSIREQVA